MTPATPASGVEVCTDLADRPPLSPGRVWGLLHLEVEPGLGAELVGTVDATALVAVLPRDQFAHFFGEDCVITVDDWAKFASTSALPVWDECVAGWAKTYPVAVAYQQRVPEPAEWAVPDPAFPFVLIDGAIVGQWMLAHRRHDMLWSAARHVIETSGDVCARNHDRIQTVADLHDFWESLTSTRGWGALIYRLGVGEQEIQRLRTDLVRTLSIVLHHTGRNAVDALSTVLDPTIRYEDLLWPAVGHLGLTPQRLGLYLAADVPFEEALRLEHSPEGRPTTLMLHTVRALRAR